MTTDNELEREGANLISLEASHKHEVAKWQHEYRMKVLDSRLYSMRCVVETGTVFVAVGMVLGSLVGVAFRWASAGVSALALIVVLTAIGLSRI